MSMARARWPPWLLIKILSSLGNPSIISGYLLWSLASPKMNESIVTVILAVILAASLAARPGLMLLILVSQIDMTATSLVGG
jgi:hypothetical protein